ncbi:MAG: carbohydrate kinase family protein [Fusobacteriota bacterium]
MKKVLVFGGVSYNIMAQVDEFPKGKPGTIFANEYHETIGSTGAGKSMALNKLDVNFSFHGVIGEDIHGDVIKDYFQKRDIDFYYDIDPAGTERHVNFMKNETGERLSLFLHAAPQDIDLDEEKIEKLIKDSDIVFLNVAPYCKRFIDMIKKYDKEIWCDLHSYDGDDYYNEFINAADVLILSSDNLENYEDFMEKEIKKGKKYVIATHGNKGSSIMTQDKKIKDFPIYDYDVVDTNGAGDNFSVGFLYGYLNEYTVEKSMKLATITAGLAITSKELYSEELSPKKLEEEYRRLENHKL